MPAMAGAADRRITRALFWCKRPVLRMPGLLMREMQCCHTNVKITKQSVCKILMKFLTVAVACRKDPEGGNMFLDSATVIGFVIAVGTVGVLIYVCKTAGCGK
jgi:hypothetical protein